VVHEADWERQLLSLPQNRQIRQLIVERSSADALLLEVLLDPSHDFP
jgi:hypothetical protein